MIITDIEYNRQLDTINGVYYDVNGNLVIDEGRIVVDEETIDQHYVHDCVGNEDCNRCSENQDFTLERIRLSPLTSKMMFILERECRHQLGSVFGSWTVTPSK